MLKSTISKKQQTIQKYPILKVHDSNPQIIVLFTNAGVGVIVASTVKNQIGTYTSFNEDVYIKYDGSVTIEND